MIEMDLEYLVMKEVLENFPEMFKVLLCYFHLKKGMRKNCMSKVGKSMVEEDEDFFSASVLYLGYLYGSTY